MVASRLSSQLALPEDSTTASTKCGPSVADDIRDLLKFAGSFLYWGFSGHPSVPHQPSTNLVLEVRRVANADYSVHSCQPNFSGDSTASVASIPPIRSDIGLCSVEVGRETLALLGFLSACRDMCFKVFWKEHSHHDKSVRDNGHKLEALGDYSIAVDGIIIPRHDSCDIYEGSQITLMTKQSDKDKYVVLLILQVHFERIVEPSASPQDEEPCWGACLLRR